MIENSSLDKCKEYLLNANRVLFITGAGVSAESGLPTYRGVSGLYETQSTEEGLPIEDMLSGEMLRRRPELTWKYLMQIARACEGKLPNQAHRTIANMQSRWDVCVITQNIDGFHTEAGSNNVIEMHGNMKSLTCMSCQQKKYIDSTASLNIPPLCEACGGILRPDVVLFGEMLPEYALEKYHTELAKGFDVIFSVGTSSVFPYISGPVENAIRMGVPTIEINPSETHLSRLVSVKVPCEAGEFLLRLRNLLF